MGDAKSKVIKVNNDEQRVLIEFSPCFLCLCYLFKALKVHEEECEERSGKINDPFLILNEVKKGEMVVNGSQSRKTHCADGFLLFISTFHSNKLLNMSLNEM